MIFNSLSQTGRTELCSVVYVESYSLVSAYVVFNRRKTSASDKISDYNPEGHVAFGTTEGTSQVLEL